MFIFPFENMVKDIKKYICKGKQVNQTPPPSKSNTPKSPEITSIMKRNKSNDDFIKIQLPWIL